MHSRFYHEAELMCVLSVGPHTHVRAEGYSHASLVRAGEGFLNLHADDHRAFSICAVVNRPSPCAISKTVTPAMIVGTWKAPLAMNSSSERASRKGRQRALRLRILGDCGMHSMAVTATA